MSKAELNRGTRVQARRLRPRDFTMKFTRSALCRAAGATLPLLLFPPSAYPADFGEELRRAVVRSAQIADKADAVWQQFSGEVVPSWERSQPLPQRSVPPAEVDTAFATESLALALESAASVANVRQRLYHVIDC